MAITIQRTVDTELIKLLEKRQLLGELDPKGQRLLDSLNAELVLQERQFEIAKDGALELRVVSKQMALEKAAADAELFKSSASGMTINQAIYTPGYVTVETMPQINTALSNYNTLLRNNPGLLNDPDQKQHLPYSRRELFTLGRNTCKVEMEGKGHEVEMLEEVTKEYECALQEKHGKEFKCEHVTEEQLEAVKTKSGRDILNFMNEDPSQHAKSPPQIERQKSHQPSRGGGINIP
jgi:hypothetical protein